MAIPPLSGRTYEAEGAAALLPVDDALGALETLPEVLGVEVVDAPVDFEFESEDVVEELPDDALIVDLPESRESLR